MLVLDYHSGRSRWCTWFGESTRRRSARLVEWRAWSKSRPSFITTLATAASSRSTFNGGTVPGENNVVVLEWTDEALMSPMRGGNDLPQAALQVGAQVREYIEDQRIEFMELLTPDKMMDV